MKLMHVLCASVAQYTKFSDSMPIELKLLSQLEFCCPFLCFSILSSSLSPFLCLLLFSSLCLSAEQEAFIPGLLPETTYSVTVAAYTTKGDGARSKAKVATTTGAGVCVLPSTNTAHLRIYLHHIPACFLICIMSPFNTFQDFFTVLCSLIFSVCLILIIILANVGSIDWI